ncbi:hypothetical protein [uncultured Roseobacter sp.]|uniref:hypothetical protein n=1 Tax=uncultured Roseobacter sp. TaxID=114847 RepID=UPI00262C3DD0|nr:hypothetical protein [uncultured Roseobacter sp.]
MTGWGKWLQLVLDGLFALLVGAVLWWGNLTAAGTLPGVIIWLVMVYVAIYNPVSRFRTGLAWNDEGIRRTGLFRDGPVRHWDDLKDMHRSPHARSTVLEFGLLRKIRVRWSYDAHRDIIQIAERKLKKDA